MGLLDQVLGGRDGGGLMGGNSVTSPMIKAVLMLLAAKAVTSGFGQGSAAPVPQNTTPSQPQSGGLGGLLGGLFGGGAPGGGNLGNILNQAGSGGGGLGGILGGLMGGAASGGGLGSLVNSFNQAGYGPKAQSWINSGPNDPLQPTELEKALGPEAIQSLQQHTGMSRDELLAQLSKVLPSVVDKLTPQGRLPTDQEVQQHW